MDHPTRNNTALSDNTPWIGPVDLSNCEREPIHIPGLIQSHGALVCLSGADLTIVQVSANTEAIVGMAPQTLLQQPVEVLLGNEQATQLRNGSQRTKELTLSHAWTVTVNQTPFQAIVHHVNALPGDGNDQQPGAMLVLELEPTGEQGLSIEFARIDSIFSSLQQAGSLTEFCQLAAQEIRSLTGFDRIMVYRFDANYDGEVIAEASRDDLAPFLGLHYPASDIPPQARRLYLANPIRLIPDVSYQPVGLVPETNPLTGGPLNMSEATLRSVSPLHIEYLHNMGVGASMSVSIIVEGKLWGLFACHHYAPHFVAYPLRKACTFLARVFSMLLLEKQRLENAAYELRIQTNHTRLLEVLSRSDQLFNNLHQSDVTVLDLLDAEGAAVCLEGQIALLGNTPDQEVVAALVEWLQKSVSDEVFHTNSLSSRYPEAQAYAAVASGLLAVAVSRVQSEYLLWFRPEVVQTVTWAGNPSKAVVPSENGVRLSPRKSFEAWTQLVKHTALPWQPIEIRAAAELRGSLLDIALKISGELKLRADILSRLNEELERSNDELDSFAYVASHDLKEPLRGIHNYAGFLLEDYESVLDEAGVSKLQTLVRLSRRMEELLDSLLHFSRVGRLELAMQPTDLNALLHDVLQLLNWRIENTGTQIRIPQPLPTVQCDSLRMEEVFSNLITNALKYNDKSEKWIEIGFQLPPEGSFTVSNSGNLPYTFFVRDNGIGIDLKHFENIFRIFKRLHTKDKYGGGTGAGLTIVKKIIERHGGRIWVESSLGNGTTFYFTLIPN